MVIIEALADKDQISNAEVYGKCDDCWNKLCPDGA